ncbi:MAG: aspartate-semialdehyde dehydrogenase [Myxococcota bacterium]|nr:aspartate-semialdehyde dehydrogenase [Myxococcota bacterium]
MKKEFRIAIVGATGLVGREILTVLEERGFPIGELKLLASERSAGQKLDFGDRAIPVEIATPEAFKGIDIALFSAGASVARDLGPKAANAGAIVIDNSSAWRMDPEIPLVVPEVNPEDIANHKNRGIIANPNCSTIQMVVALKPLHDKAGLKRVVVSTYQAVSGAGKEAMEELSSQVPLLFAGKDIEPKLFSKQIAFNCIPHIDVFADDDFTKEEWKMILETRKIMHLPELKICATCVRVPVFNGHAESISSEFKTPLSADDAKKILREAPGIFLQDVPAENIYPTQTALNGSDATAVGRIRNDPSCENGIAFWCVADNLRKGAASNAVQIAEILARDYLS